MNVATIDLGSNSFLLAIFEMENNKIISNIHDECVITRLSEGVDKNKILSAAALKRAKDCLTNFRKTIDKYNVEKIVAVSTSAARDAKNKEEFLKIGNDLNIPVQIIPGQKEAELTFKGATFEHENPKDYCVIDVGGGSTEIITQSDQIGSFSFDVGSVRLTEKFITSFPTSDVEIKNLEDFIKANFEQKKELFSNLQNKKVIA
ncbi:Ppx/GppA family phosphatase, partial [bacterium]|nr:Ppx/GppA family phosphatase [bacterium]